MRIRKANTEDYKEIQKISWEELDYECTPDFVKHRLENIDDNNEAVVVADENGAAVGFVHADIYRTLYFEGMINILGIAVSKSCQKKGYGKELMTTAENWSKEKGIKIVRLKKARSVPGIPCLYQISLKLKHLPGTGRCKKNIKIFR